MYLLLASSHQLVFRHETHCDACLDEAVIFFQTTNFRRVKPPRMWVCSSCLRFAPGRFNESQIQEAVEHQIGSAASEEVRRFSDGFGDLLPAGRAKVAAVRQRRDRSLHLIVRCNRGKRVRIHSLAVDLSLPVSAHEWRAFCRRALVLFRERFIIGGTVLADVSPGLVGKLTSDARAALTASVCTTAFGGNFGSVVQTVFTVPILLKILADPSLTDQPVLRTEALKLLAVANRGDGASTKAA